MSWFNYIGLIILVVIMIPNVIYAFKHRFVNHNISKVLEIFEQIGRYGSFILMVFNIPYLYYGIWFNNGLIIYIIVNTILVLTYIIFWIICFNKHPLLKAYVLSIIPSTIFIVSGIIVLNYPLIVFSIIFAISHITISLKNAYFEYKNK